MSFSRRDFLKAAGVGAAAGTFVTPGLLMAKEKARVVVIGGGYGGAIAAKYIRMADPSISVTLIEMNKNYVSCPLSNEVLGGEREMASLTYGYEGLAGHGVKVVIDQVTDVDAAKRTIRTKGGNTLTYDKLVVSPGVDFRYEAIDGYDATVAEKIPHAWKAGPQTVTLRKQLMGMKDGGVVTIVAPPNPFRCPPGPYERAAQIAHYLKKHKPKSKVMILDPKPKFSKAKLFRAGWKAHYGDMIEWVGGKQGGKVSAIDAKGMVAMAGTGKIKSAVMNVIPPQKAGKIAFAAGLTNEKGWCPVNQHTFESTIHKDIYVIGDSSVAGKMPKSGYAANSQGKVCAASIVAAVNGEPLPEPSYVNTCYSIIAPDHGISVAKVYELKDGKIVGIKGSGGLSPMDASARTKAQEVDYAKSWFKNVMADMFT